MHLERAERLPTLQDEFRQLVRVLGPLRWRLGLEQMLVFAMRGLGASALALVAVSLTGWLIPEVSNGLNLAWAAAVPLAVALGLAVLRWPSERQAALAADRRLLLEERLSTALELATRRRTANSKDPQAPQVRASVGGRFDRLQLQDAVDRAGHAPKNAWLSLDRQTGREALLVTALLALAGGSLVLPGLPRPGLPIGDRPVSIADSGPAIDLQDRALPLEAPAPAAATTESIQQTQADADLTSRVQKELVERDALDKLSQALGGLSAGQPAADALQRGDYASASDQLTNLGEQADQLSSAAKQQLSRDLAQAAAATAATDKQLADREQQAAQALSKTNYGDQRQALRNLADQVQRSGAGSASADQLAKDVGRLQQATGQASTASAQAQRTRSQTQANAAPGRGAPGTQASAAAPGAGAGQTGTGADQGGQPGGPGVGTGSNPDVLSDQPSRLETSSQNVQVPTRLGSGPGVRPANGSEDQTGSNPSTVSRTVSELAQPQQTGQVVPEQNLVPGEQRPVVRGYFR